MHGEICLLPGVQQGLPQPEAAGSKEGSSIIRGEARGHAATSTTTPLADSVEGIHSWAETLTPLTLPQKSR